MRIVETIHPNPQFRTFTVDRILSTVRISKTSHLFSTETPTEEAKKLFNQLNDIPILDDDLAVDRYEVSVKIVEAFADNEKDWNDVRNSVFYCLANFFKVDIIDIEYAHSIKDARNKYKEKIVDLNALYGIISKVKISHDFETHRQAWRNAIVIAKGMQEDYDKANNERIHDGPNVYWQNELEKFDAAFDALLALKLPQF